jgi:hypothetical protein
VARRVAPIHRSAAAARATGAFAVRARGSSIIAAMIGLYSIVEIRIPEGNRFCA